MPAEDEMPATVKRSPAKVKHSFEKVGDRWQPKREKGPSDPPGAGRSSPRRGRKTFGGVDVVGNSRQALYERAKGLKLTGRSSMFKESLAEAIAHKP